MKADSLMTVGAIARLAGLTVRTMHHYDEIGLVPPGERSRAGYRLYGPSEIERLQEVLFYRELGFSLEKIKEMLSRPGYERGSALLRQREMLGVRLDRLMGLIGAIDVAIEARRTGMALSKKDMLEGFEGFDPTEYEQEAAERWGETDGYAESIRRTKSYTKTDWATLKAEADEISQSFLVLMVREVPPDSVEAMEVAERHRAHISSWFYECSVEVHAGLGRMYVGDSRFTTNIDKAGEGLAAYMSEAIAANAGRFRKTP